MHIKNMVIFSVLFVLFFGINTNFAKKTAQPETTTPADSIAVEIFNKSSYKLKFIDFDLRKTLGILKDRKIEFSPELAPGSKKDIVLKIEGRIARVQVKYNKEGFKVDDIAEYPCYLNLALGTNYLEKIILNIYNEKIELVKVYTKK